MNNISNEEELKCFMIKSKEDQKFKNHTPIGEKSQSKNNT